MTRLRCDLPEWRPMRAEDIAPLTALSDAVHGAYSEPEAVYAERLVLYPAGCWVLSGVGGSLLGYCISHPWQGEVPPPLHALLGRLPDAPDSYYLHDIALDPAARGLRAGEGAIERVVAAARGAGLDALTLTAVAGADRYWARQGFVATDPQPPALAGYGGEARWMRRML